MSTKSKLNDDIIEDILEKFDEHCVLFEREVSDDDKIETCGVIMSSFDDQLLWLDKLNDVGCVPAAVDLIVRLMKTDYYYITFSEDNNSDMEYNKNLIVKWNNEVHDTIMKICNKESSQRDSFEDFLRNS